jgi:hypothetical protein
MNATSKLSAMKQIQFVTISALLITCFCFAQCKKNNNTSTSDNPYGLPNATQNGTGIFACLINGQKFIAGYQDNPFAHDYQNGYLFYGDTLIITGEPKNGGYFQLIDFSINGNLHQGQIYNIDSVNVIAFYISDSTCQSISSSEVRSYSRTGTIELTRFDSANQIISGIFNCAFAIPNCDTLHVTDGRFDYHYY